MLRWAWARILFWRHRMFPTAADRRVAEWVKRYEAENAAREASR